MIGLSAQTFEEKDVADKLSLLGADESGFIPSHPYADIAFHSASIGNCRVTNSGNIGRNPSLHVSIAHNNQGIRIDFIQAQCGLAFSLVEIGFGKAVNSTAVQRFSVVGIGPDGQKTYPEWILGQGAKRVENTVERSTYTESDIGVIFETTVQSVEITCSSDKDIATNLHAFSVAGITHIIPAHARADASPCGREGGLLCLIDNSGSMEQSKNARFFTTLRSMCEAREDWVEGYGKVELAWFDAAGIGKTTAFYATSELLSYLNDPDFDKKTPLAKGFTDFETAWQYASTTDASIVILVTDGLPNAKGGHRANVSMALASDAGIFKKIPVGIYHTQRNTSADFPQGLWRPEAGKDLSEWLDENSCRSLPNNDIRVLPNPTSGDFSVLLPNNLTLFDKIEILDKTGRVMSCRMTIEQGKIRVHVGNIPPDTYILLAKAGEKCFQKRIVIVR